MFQDRTDAGRQLAQRLLERGGEAGGAGAVVMALPRGGVVVGFEVALALGAPLDVLVVRKLGAPHQPELAIGAVVLGDGEAPHITLSHDLVQRLRVDPEYVEAETSHQVAEIRRREAEYRSHRPPVDVAGRTVILVDDGIATGSSVRAALRALRQRRPGRLLLAVPVAAPDSLDALRPEADEVVCLAAPQWFAAVGQFYADFRQTTDDEVVSLLDRARTAVPPSR